MTLRITKFCPKGLVVSKISKRSIKLQGNRIEEYFVYFDNQKNKWYPKLVYMISEYVITDDHFIAKHVSVEEI